MANRKIKKVHKAVSAPIGNLITHRALPTREVEYIDPFLFLNHHGPQTYGPNNSGLPFGPHPHRGFETLTFILEGDIMHQDTGGGQSVIEKGGVQWMTAGSGLIHAEVSSEKFKREGGPLEILQLWLNLPAKHKMVKPHYIGLAQEEIPSITENGGKVKVNLISGQRGEVQGLVHSLGGISMSSVELEQSGTFQTRIPTAHNIFFYVVRGQVNVNGQAIGKLHLVEFENEGEEINIEALKDAYILLGHAKPFNEPVVAHGPFVMNTEQEIQEAFHDYQQGKMGKWHE